MGMAFAPQPERVSLLQSRVFARFTRGVTLLQSKAWIS